MFFSQRLRLLLSKFRFYYMLLPVPLRFYFCICFDLQIVLTNKEKSVLLTESV